MLDLFLADHDVGKFPLQYPHNVTFTGLFVSIFIQLLLRRTCVFKHQNLQMFGLKLNKYVEISHS